MTRWFAWSLPSSTGTPAARSVSTKRRGKLLYWRGILRSAGSGGIRPALPHRICADAKCQASPRPRRRCPARQLGGPVRTRLAETLCPAGALGPAAAALLLLVLAVRLLAGAPCPRRSGARLRLAGAAAVPGRGGGDARSGLHVQRHRRHRYRHEGGPHPVAADPVGAGEQAQCRRVPRGAGAGGPAGPHPVQLVHHRARHRLAGADRDLSVHEADHLVAAAVPRARLLLRRAARLDVAGGRAELAAGADVSWLDPVG